MKENELDLLRQILLANIWALIELKLILQNKSWAQGFVLRYIIVYLNFDVQQSAY